MHTFAIELAVIELGQTIAWRWWIRVRGVQWRCEGPTVDFSRLTHSWCTKVARLTGAKMPYRRWRPLTTYWGDKEPYTTSQRQFQWRQAAEERGFADCIAKQVARFSEVGDMRSWTIYRWLHLAIMTARKNKNIVRKIIKIYYPSKMKLQPLVMQTKRIITWFCSDFWQSEIIFD